MDIHGKGHTLIGQASEQSLAVAPCVPVATATSWEMYSRRDPSGEKAALSALPWEPLDRGGGGGGRAHACECGHVEGGQGRGTSIVSCQVGAGTWIGIGPVPQCGAPKHCPHHHSCPHLVSSTASPKLMAPLEVPPSLRDCVAQYVSALISM